MKPARTIGAFIAMTVSASAHLAFLNTFSSAPPPVLIEGGSVQVELGLNAASSPASAAGAQPSQTEQSDPSEQDSPDEDKSPPAPEKDAPKPDPLDKPAPSANTSQPVAPAMPVEKTQEAAAGKPPENSPHEAPESSRTTEPEEKTQAEPAAQPKPETSQAEKAKAHPSPIGGAASAYSAGSGSDGASAAQPAAKAGNAESENYAGKVMEHLSRVRRPRASVPGSALVSFSIAPSGKLESVSIVKSSGSAQFDRDAIKMVERAAPFPKPPPGVNRDFVVEIEGS